MGVEKDGKKIVKERKRFTLDLRDDVVGRFLLQLPQEKRPEFVRRLLEATILSGDAYDLADDFGFEVSNPKGRSRRRILQPQVLTGLPREIDRPSKSQSPKQKGTVALPASDAVNVGDQQDNVKEPGSIHSVVPHFENDRVHSPPSGSLEQSLADQMQQAQQEVAKGEQDARTAMGAGSVADGAQSNDSAGLASQRGEAGSKETERPKSSAAAEPGGDTAGLQQKVPPKISLAGFFGERPRSIRNGE
ncbi:hypothetical protein [uncultured Hydrogenophaga sp.]|uniref:hypothetical protein n=1 Tax=uncultured Hydrogenophaga sp. TaxID=199683 RepID=UPI002585DFC9|nr:hypothetical protein [uncultured Hydrogenophaga sp.]